MADYCEACFRAEATNGKLCKNCYSIKRRFLVNPKDVATLRASQQFSCKICGKYCSTDRALGVDHDHITGKVRGLLCLRCNIGLGYLNTSDVLRSAANYLEQPLPLIEHYTHLKFRAPIGEEDRRVAQRIYTEEGKSLRERARDLAMQLGISFNCALSRIRRVKV